MSNPKELSSLNGLIETIPIFAVASDEILEDSPAAMISNNPSLLRSLIANFTLNKLGKKLPLGPSKNSPLSVKYNLLSPWASLSSSWS